MATLDPVVAGDVNQVRARTLSELDTLEDGTGEGVATVVAHIWRDYIDPESLACTVTDAATRVIAIDFGDADGWLASRPDPGPWLVEYEVTYTEDDMVVTVPAEWPDTIIVRADHNPAAP